MLGAPLSATQLRVSMLGSLRIERDTCPIHLPTRKTEILFAYLILHPDAHTREKLAGLFWGDSSDENARGSLRKALTLLRKHIASDIILADRESVQLNPSFPLWVDAIGFEEQAGRFLADPSTDLNRIDLELYPDDLLTDSYDDWTLPLREHYRDIYLKSLLCIVQELRAQSEYKLAIEYVQRVLACDAANEPAHQHLMFCYITLGERNKALEQYQACQRALEDELGVEPSRQTQALHKWIQQAVLDIPSQAARVTNLPIPISSFVGRSREMAKIKAVLSKARLVTLTGAGGSGKTRLAIHVGTDLIDSFRDGVWWVELAPLTDASLVPSAVAKTLGISETSDRPLIETLAEYLCKKQLILVLDNCEHLIEAAANLAESLLSACPDLKILCTSREALGLVGENVWYVPTLSLPEPQKLTYAELLMQYESILLFVERARAVRPEFNLTEECAVAVVQICQHLDGIPLAIELAAARVKMMSVEQIAARLDDRFQLLTTSERATQARHQTLRATVDWSYDLLSGDERQLLCRLSVFAGGWTLEAAEAICSGEGFEQGDVLDLLTRLVDKSLVTITPDGKRYGMLETMRQYAKEKLIEAGMEDWIIEQHLGYFTNLAEMADEKIRGPEQLAWIIWFDGEQNNLASAMRRSLNHSSWIEKGVELVSNTFSYWFIIGDFIQIRYWLDIAISQSAFLGRTPTRANILINAGMCSGHGLTWLKPPETRTLIQEALEILQESGPEFALEMAQCRLILGFVQKHHFYEDSGIDSVRECIEIFKELGAHWWHAWALKLLENLIRDTSDAQIIRSMLEREATLWKMVGDQWGQAIVLLDRGILEKDCGDFEESEMYLLESLKMFKEVGRVGYISRVLAHLGRATRGQKKYDLAETYYNKSLELASFAGMLLIQLVSYSGLGYLALLKGDDKVAEEYFCQSLRLAQRCDHKLNLIFCLMNFACLAAFRENSIPAARFFGAFFTGVESLKKMYGLGAKIIYPQHQMDLDRYLALCKDQIDKSTFDQAYNAGRLLSLDEAIDEIMQARGEKVILEL